jgi:hypothetical protein
MKEHAVEAVRAEWRTIERAYAEAGEPETAEQLAAMREEYQRIAYREQTRDSRVARRARIRSTSNAS